MDIENEGPAGWYGPVLADLAKALRRDGLYQAAEFLDDAALVAVREQKKRAKEKPDGRPPELRLVK